MPKKKNRNVCTEERKHKQIAVRKANGDPAQTTGMEAMAKQRNGESLTRLVRKLQSRRGWAFRTATEPPTPSCWFPLCGTTFRLRSGDERERRSALAGTREPKPTTEPQPRPRLSACRGATSADCQGRLRPLTFRSESVSAVDRCRPLSIGNFIF